MTIQLTDLIADRFKIKRTCVDSIVQMYDDHATIPFVARYRKDQTGNLDEVAVTGIYDAITYFRELFARKSFILEEISRKGKLTDELRQKIEECMDAKKLEDLYLPYKEKKKTKADRAREAGLEPLAAMLLSAFDEGDPLERARQLINTEKGYDTAEKVLEGALFIIAQKVIESVDLMENFLKSAFSGGTLTSRKKKGYEGADPRFEDYYEYSEELSRLRQERNSHRFLAIKRGIEVGALGMKIEVDDDEHIYRTKQEFCTYNYFYREHVEHAVEIAYTHYLRPALDTRILSELTEASESEAIRVFGRNLESLLMASPIPYKNVLGMDPGLRTGVKVAVLDRDGTFLEHGVLFINSPGEAARSKKDLGDLIKKHNLGAISIGNGTGSRETLAFVKDALRTLALTDIIVAVVNESGASVYSASEIAREEFPHLDLTVRGAISIGRRLQNPLAELVKIDPKSIGVGQYQHDVNQKRLKEALERVIQFCVNHVGVDVNTASYAILTHISGLSEKIARNIVQHRVNKGFFGNRREILDVRGVGEKIFEQCAGFLMIRGGDNPLDNTRVHPESYEIVRGIAEKSGVTIHQVIGNESLLKRLNPGDFLTGIHQIHNVTCLFEDLMHPGQDPRKEYRNITYRDDVASLEDLKEQMTLEGRVTNVTNFGAFIDIGVHQDGLCHKSNMADRFVRDPAEIVSVGDIVRVLVLAVDVQKKRISLKLVAK